MQKPLTHDEVKKQNNFKKKFVWTFFGHGWK
jgi:hypothetical protein